MPWPELPLPVRSTFTRQLNRLGSGKGRAKAA